MKTQKNRLVVLIVLLAMVAFTPGCLSSFLKKGSAPANPPVTSASSPASRQSSNPNAGAPLSSSAAQGQQPASGLPSSLQTQYHRNGRGVSVTVHVPIRTEYLVDVDGPRVGEGAYVITNHNNKNQPLIVQVDGYFFGEKNDENAMGLMVIEPGDSIPIGNLGFPTKTTFRLFFLDENGTPVAFVTKMLQWPRPGQPAHTVYWDVAIGDATPISEKFKATLLPTPPAATPTQVSP